MYAYKIYYRQVHIRIVDDDDDDEDDDDNAIGCSNCSTELSVWHRSHLAINLAGLHLFSMMMLWLVKMVMMMI